ncbi:hypothetical protein D3C81_1574740 [compost metagenome]
MTRVAVDRFFKHVLQVGNGGRIQVGNDAGGVRHFTDAAVHPGHIDCRVGLLLLEFCQGGRRGTHLGRDSNSGSLGERFCNTTEERFAPVAAVQRNGQFLLFCHGAL